MGENVIVMMQNVIVLTVILQNIIYFPPSFFALFLEWNMSWTMFLLFLCLLKYEK